MPSTAIRGFSYLPQRRELRVEFVTRRVYVYFDVPAKTVEEFRAAESKGRHFNTHIRDHYRFRELVREEAS